MIRIVILGSGNVAHSLAMAVAKSELNLVQIYARDTTAGSQLASQCGCDYTDSVAKLASADLYILAVSDRSIESLSEQLNIGDESVLAHTAGCVPVDALSVKVKNRAVIYPLQTFTKGRETPFSHIPIMIEGITPHAIACARLFSERLSENVIEMSSEKRAKVHLSAVFACNFVNHMYSISEKLVNQADVPFDILKPLILETAQKALAADSPTQTQTGPAKRNDYQTKSKHCELLMHQPEFKTMYINLSNSIWETSKKI